MADIDWSNAAVIAAVLGGFFALSKELVTFCLDRVRAALNSRIERRRLQGRLGQFYFQIAVGATRALEAWIEAKAQLQELGLEGLPQPPSVDFVSYGDPMLDQHLADLSIRTPELVSRYIQVVQLQQAATEALHSEHETFEGTAVPFSYPRTRRILRGLLETAVNGLQQVSDAMPENLWNPCAGPKAAYERAAKEFGRRLAIIPPISHDEVKRETLRALAMVQNPG